MFMVSLSSIAHFCTLKNSSSKEFECFSGTSKMASSAYLTNWLVVPAGFESAMRIINRHGPTPQPCTIERLIAFIPEIFVPILVNWALSLRNDRTHSITYWFNPYSTSFFIKMAWFTVSNALELFWRCWSCTCSASGQPSSCKTY